MGERVRIVVRGVPGRRFLAKVDFDGPVPYDVSIGPCWLWTGATSGDDETKGYGWFRAGPGDTEYAHRWIWIHINGPIPDGYQVDHKCHVWWYCMLDEEPCPHRLCVNPEHLQLLTPADNNARSGSPSAVNARKDHCAGDPSHPFTPENTYIHPKRGTRHCIACQRENAARYERKRAMVTGSAAKRRASRAPGPNDRPLFEIVTDPQRQ